MGNPKLRFSEFIPNSWFHKPKSVHRHQPTTRPPPISSAGELPLSLSPPRKSYHFTRNLIAPKSSEIDSPRKSPKRRIRRKPIAQKSNPSEACNHKGNHFELLHSEIDYKGNHFELLPFGSGRRICVGLSLAIRMLPLMLGNLLNFFEWKLEDGVKPEDMNMDDKFGISLQKATPLYAIPVVCNSG